MVSSFQALGSTLPKNVNDFCETFKLEGKLSKSDKRHLNSFLSVVKMKELGETCMHCRDPNPYKYILSRKLCRRCYDYKRTFDSFPSHPKWSLKQPIKVKTMNKIIQLILSGDLFENNEPGKVLDEDLNKQEEAVTQSGESVKQLNNDKPFDNDPEPDCGLDLNNNSDIRIKKDGFLIVDFLGK